MEEKKWMTLNEVQEKFGSLATLKEIFYDWMGLNQWLFLQINHIRGDYYDSLMLLINEFGVRHHLPYALVFFAIVALAGTLMKLMKKQGGAKQYAIRWLGVFIIMIAGFAANYVIIGGLKDFFAFPRPYAALTEATSRDDSNPERVYVLERRPADDAHRSFPSGHVAFITLMVVALWPLLNDMFRYVGGILIFGVAWARMSLGVHFPADVLWSFIIVTLTVIFLRYWIYKLLRLIGLNC